MPHTPTYCRPRDLAIVTMLLGLVSPPSHGSGFSIIEQSVAGLGNAFAGGAASAEDASTVFFNPAGMSRLHGRQTLVGAHIIVPSAKFQNQGSSITSLAGGSSLGSNNGGDAGVAAAVPNLYQVVAVNQKLKFGVGVSAPFGLKTEYNPGWVGRYYAIDSSLQTVNINPSLAYRVNSKWSVGAGIAVQYAKADLSNAIDYGTLYVLGGGSPSNLAPQAADGRVRVTGDGWGVGANLGVMYQATERTRIGLAYRSRIRYTLKGDARFTTPANPYAAGTASKLGLTNTGASARLTTPDTLSLSVFNQINTHWAVMADITRTRWSVLNELRVKFNSSAQDSVITTNWRDTNRYSVGASYAPNSRWVWRAGVAYDQTPVPDAQHRSPRIPDGNRTWLAFGFGYKQSDNLRFDVGYAHLFIDNPKINKTDTGVGSEDLTRGNLVGTYNASVDIVSAQAQWSFF